MRKYGILKTSLWTFSIFVLCVLITIFILYPFFKTFLVCLIISLIYYSLYYKINKYLVDYCYTFNKMTWTKMKFSNWLDIYNLAPEKWSFQALSTEASFFNAVLITYLIPRNKDRYIIIYFNFFDWLKFDHWYNHIYQSKIYKEEVNKEKLQENKDLMFILKNAQKDIDELKSQAEKEFNDSYKFIKEVAQNAN